MEQDGTKINWLKYWSNKNEKHQQNLSVKEKWRKREEVKTDLKQMNLNHGQPMPTKHKPLRFYYFLNKNLWVLSRIQMIIISGNRPQNGKTTKLTKNNDDRITQTIILSKIRKKKYLKNVSTAHCRPLHTFYLLPSTVQGARCRRSCSNLSAYFFF